MKNSNNAVRALVPDGRNVTEIDWSKADALAVGLGERTAGLVLCRNQDGLREWLPYMMWAAGPGGFPDLAARCRELAEVVGFVVPEDETLGSAA